MSMTIGQALLIIFGVLFLQILIGMITGRL